MSLRAVLAAIALGPHHRGGGQPRKGGSRQAGSRQVRSRPIRLWPADESLWLRENGAWRPRAARHVLRALATLGQRGRYAAHPEGHGKVVTGPVSALALPDAEAEIRFVFRITPSGYGEADF